MAMATALALEIEAGISLALSQAKLPVRPHSCQAAGSSPVLVLLRRLQCHEEIYVAEPEHPLDRACFWHIAHCEEPCSASGPFAASPVDWVEDPRSLAQPMYAAIDQSWCLELAAVFRQKCAGLLLLSVWQAMAEAIEMQH